MKEPRCICYEVLNDGEGELGRKVEVFGYREDANQSAEAAAKHFDDLDKQAGGLTDSDLHGCSRVIEVRGFFEQPPSRHRVRCEVIRQYCPSKIYGWLPTNEEGTGVQGR